MSSLYAVVLGLIVLCAAVAAQSAAGYSGSANSDVQYEATFVRSVTYRELRQWHSQGSEVALTSSHEMHFGVVPVKTRVSRFVQVFNPTERPILAQLALLPNNTEELVRYGCKQHFTPSKLDDEEFENEQELPLRCQSDDVEIDIAKNLSAQAPPSFPRFSSNMSLFEKFRQFAIYCENRSLKKDKQSSRMNLLPRYKCGRNCSWVLADNEINAFMLRSQSQGFFLPSKSRAAVVIPPHESASVGPVLFQGEAVGAFEGRVFVRTNASLFDSITLTAETKYSRLAFRKVTVARHSPTHQKQSAFTHPQEMESLAFDITEADIENQYTAVSGSPRLPQTIRVVKVYQAENVGTLPLLISGFLINGQSCSLMDVTVENCGSAYLLQPKETVDVVVSYRVTFLQRELQVQLWVVTEEDSFFLPLNVSVHVESMHRLAAIQSTDSDCPIYFLSELCTLINIAITTGYVVALLQEVAAQKPKRSHLETARLRVGRDSFSLLTQLRAPVLCRRPAPACEESLGTLESLAPLEPLQPHEDEEDVKLQLDAQKQKKIKKNKGSILKFAPANDSLKSAQSESQTIFATNRLLLTKKKPKKVDSTDFVPCAADLESEKPGGKEACFESNTTAHSEDGENEDEYLDDYKTRKGLFSGFSLRGSS